MVGRGRKGVSLAVQRWASAKDDARLVRSGFEVWQGAVGTKELTWLCDDEDEDGLEMECMR